jgi:hypothetical protein
VKAEQTFMPIGQKDRIKERKKKKTALKKQKSFDV